MLDASRLLCALFPERLSAEARNLGEESAGRVCSQGKRVTVLSVFLREREGKGVLLAWTQADKELWEPEIMKEVGQVRE